MHAYLNLKIRAFHTIQSDGSCYSSIGCHYCIHKPLINSQLTQSPPHNLPWNSVKGLFQIHKGHPKFFFLFQISFLQLAHNEYRICSSTTRPEPKLKSIYVNLLSHSILKHSLINLHYLFKQLNASV